MLSQVYSFVEDQHYTSGGFVLVVEEMILIFHCHTYFFDSVHECSQTSSFLDPI